MKLVGLAAVGLAAALAIPSGAEAQGENPQSKEMFERYCGTCHGADGKGAGVMSGFLKKQPADLTQISKKNGGEFPFHQTMRFIDGTQDVRAHGDPDMPVWGEVFKHETAGSPGQQAAIRTKILLITQYVQSIQEE